MIDASSDASRPADKASTHRASPSQPAAAPQLPPPQLPPPLPGPVPASAAPARHAPRRVAVWKWILLFVLCAVAIGVFVSQSLFSGAQEFASRPGRSEPGVRHWNERVRNVPWSIHIIEIDRSRQDLGFYSGLAGNKVLGVTRVAEMTRLLPLELGKPVAAVNGDFYERDNRTYAGDPRGLQIMGGELVSSPSTTAVWFDVKGNPQVDDVRENFLVTFPNKQKLDFGLNQQRRANTAVLYTPTYGESTRVAGGRDLILEKNGDAPWLPLQPNQIIQARVREVSTAGNTKLAPDALVLSIGQQLLSKVPDVQTGAVVEVSTTLIPNLKDVKTAIAGGPALIKNGKAFTDREPPDGSVASYAERSKYERHPRSAVGWNDKKIFLITVDGRQPGLSVGMTLAELAEFMVKKLNCTDGMNFDGGASANLWMSGSLVNDACNGERAVANALILYRKDSAK